jgi:hypothetical protein
MARVYPYPRIRDVTRLVSRAGLARITVVPSNLNGQKFSELREMMPR